MQSTRKNRAPTPPSIERTATHLILALASLHLSTPRAIADDGTAKATPRPAPSASAPGEA
ncbi:hypothetical protein HUK84_20790, partial [Nguyenibacter vanlangensis]|nr:hypothetical protein [Nguyenibacter vanlangensis]